MPRRRCTVVVWPPGSDSWPDRPLYFTADVSICFLSVFFFRRLISEVSWPIVTKLCHMVGGDCNLWNWVKNLGGPSPQKFGGPKTSKLDNFATWSRISPDWNKISSIGKRRWKLWSFPYTPTNFGAIWSTNGEELLNHFYALHRPKNVKIGQLCDLIANISGLEQNPRSENGVENSDHFLTGTPILVQFGKQMAKNCLIIFMHYIVINRNNAGRQHWCRCRGRRRAWLGCGLDNQAAEAGGERGAKGKKGGKEREGR